MLAITIYEAESLLVKRNRRRTLQDEVKDAWYRLSQQ